MSFLHVTKMMIADCWKYAFDCQTIAYDECFFELGGHSLTAAKIVSKLYKEYQIKISVTDIFDFPTIQQLAEEIHKGLSRTQESPSLQRCNRSLLYPLSFAQKRLWFLYKLRPEIPLYSVPMIMKVVGEIDVKALKNALRFLMKRHEGLRTRVKIVEGQAYQEILPETTVFPFFYHHSNKKWIEDISKPFDIESDTLCRCFLHQVDATTNILSFVFHHMIFDDWSMDVFARELSSSYNQAKKGLKLVEKPLALQTLDFAVWQNKCFDNHYLEDQLKYWEHTLLNVKQIPLPYDKPRPRLLNYTGHTFSKTIGRDVFTQLQQLSNQHQVSLFILLLAAYKWLLALVAHVEDIVVGSPVSNRPFTDQKDVIGYFVNTLIFRTAFSKEDTFLKVLEKVKTCVLKGYDAQDVPFEKIVDKLKIPRELNKNPLFQVMFSIAYESEISEVTLEGCKVSKADVPLDLSKFDLSMHALVKEDSVELLFEYLTELFDFQTVENFSNLYIQILETIVENAQCTLSQVAKTLSSDVFFPHVAKEKAPRLPGTCSPILDVCSHENRAIQEQKEEGQLGAQEVFSVDQLKASMDLENALLDIWKDVLNNDALCWDSNFFEWGGSSILAVQLSDTIQKHLKITSSVIDIFEYPTIRLLSRYYSSSNTQEKYRRKASERKSQLLKFLKKPNSSKDLVA